MTPQAAGSRPPGFGTAVLGGGLLLLVAAALLGLLLPLARCPEGMWIYEAAATREGPSGPSTLSPCGRCGGTGRISLLTLWSL